MSAVLENLEAELCKALCAKVTLKERKDGNVFVQTPFVFPDGDSFSIYLKRLPSGGFRLSDMGATLMHLSYEQDIDKLREGTRSKVFAQILSEMGINDDEGELYLEMPAAHIATGVFQFGQALTRVHDLTFLNRVQVESTFYDDLKARLSDIVGQDNLIADYIAPEVPKAEEYTADFCIKSQKKPLLIWGVPNQTKARLATIVMQHLQQHKFAFRSMVVYADMSSIPRADVSRLTTAANDQIPSLSEVEALKTKVLDALALSA
jgi:hypothetical protein